MSVCAPWFRNTVWAGEVAAAQLFHCGHSATALRDNSANNQIQTLAEPLLTLDGLSSDSQGCSGNQRGLTNMLEHQTSKLATRTAESGLRQQPGAAPTSACNKK